MDGWMDSFICIAKHHETEQEEIISARPETRALFSKKARKSYACSFLKNDEFFMRLPIVETSSISYSQILDTTQTIVTTTKMGDGCGPCSLYHPRYTYQRPNDGNNTVCNGLDYKANK
jgi:hypothetical protein